MKNLIVFLFLTIIFHAQGSAQNSTTENAKIISNLGLGQWEELPDSVEASILLLLEWLKKENSRNIKITDYCIIPSELADYCYGCRVNVVGEFLQEHGITKSRLNLTVKISFISIADIDSLPEAKLKELNFLEFILE